MSFDIGDLVETDHYRAGNGKLRARVSRKIDGLLMLRATVDGRTYSIVRRPDQCINVTKGELATRTYLENTVGALNSYLYELAGTIKEARADQKYAAATAMEVVHQELLHILENGRRSE